MRNSEKWLLFFCLLDLIVNSIKDILRSLPHSPGIYQFFNASGKIIYVGKSKNLKSRVSSYFSGTQKLNFAKKQMVQYISNIEYIITNTETESLILENDLIKKHHPKYNVLLKDGKNFLYICITKEKYPKIIRTRKSPSEIQSAPGKYFGPYISWNHVAEILKLIKKIYGYGVGSHNFFKKKWSYNLDEYLFAGNIKSSEEHIHKIYTEKIQEISFFLWGNISRVKKELTEKMHQTAKQQLFEEAQKYKLSLEALENLENKQFVRDGVKGNYFVLQVLEKYEKNYLWVIEIDQGKISGYENYELENELGYKKEEIMQHIVEQKWVENQQKQQLRFILPFAIEKVITEIDYEVPELWTKYELLKLCYKNIYEYAHKKYRDSLSIKNSSKQTMSQLLDMLWYKEINDTLVFECNDISHLSGNHTVASRSVVENGKKNPKKYKRFRIKSLEEWKIDDFASMREIMSRRLKEREKLWNSPDLILIDGGKWQLWAVMEVIKSFASDNVEFPTLQIVSIAKKEEELFLPWRSEPLILEKDSSELRLLQMLRDEAHRFAISFNRDSRSKSLKKNILESLPGIGPKTRKKILTQFWNVENLKKIQRSELLSTLGKSVTENLEDHGLV